MPTQIPGDALAAIEGAVRRYPHGASTREILSILATPNPLRTLRCRLKSLVDRERLVLDGKGAGRNTGYSMLPLSFDDVPQQTYTEALLGVHELSKIDILKDVFVWTYQHSAARCAAVHQSFIATYTFRIRYL